MCAETAWTHVCPAVFHRGVWLISLALSPPFTHLQAQTHTLSSSLIQMFVCSAAAQRFFGKAGTQLLPHTSCQPDVCKTHLMRRMTEAEECCWNTQVVATLNYGNPACVWRSGERGEERKVSGSWLIGFSELPEQFVTYPPHSWEAGVFLAKSDSEYI